MPQEVYVVADWDEKHAYDSLRVFNSLALAKLDCTERRTYVVRSVRTGATCPRCEGSGKVDS